MNENDHTVITNRIEILEKDRIRQGDILKCNDFTYWGKSYIFPFIYVLTQDCDLTQDYKFNTEKTETDDKILESILVCPLFFFDDFVVGNHVKYKIENKSIIKTMEEFKGKGQNKIRKNEYDRYYYIKDFKKCSMNIIPELVMDFKFFFTIPRDNLYESYKKNYVCSVSEIFRENISRKFANFLSRIGLPEIKEEDKSECLE